MPRESVFCVWMCKKSVEQKMFDWRNSSAGREGNQRKEEGRTEIFVFFEDPHIFFLARDVYRNVHRQADILLSMSGLKTMFIYSE